MGRCINKLGKRIDFKYIHQDALPSMGRMPYPRMEAVCMSALRKYSSPHLFDAVLEMGKFSVEIIEDVHTYNGAA